MEEQRAEIGLLVCIFDSILRPLHIVHYLGRAAATIEELVAVFGNALDRQMLLEAGETTSNSLAYYHIASTVASIFGQTFAVVNRKQALDRIATYLFVLEEEDFILHCRLDVVVLLVGIEEGNTFIGELQTFGHSGVAIAVYAVCHRCVGRTEVDTQRCRTKVLSVAQKVTGKSGEVSSRGVVSQDGVTALLVGSHQADAFERMRALVNLVFILVVGDAHIGNDMQLDFQAVFELSGHSHFALFSQIDWIGQFDIGIGRRGHGAIHKDGEACVVHVANKGRCAEAALRRGGIVRHFAIEKIAVPLLADKVWPNEDIMSLYGVGNSGINLLDRLRFTVDRDERKLHFQVVSLDHRVEHRRKARLHISIGIDTHKCIDIVAKHIETQRTQRQSKIVVRAGHCLHFGTHQRHCVVTQEIWILRSLVAVMDSRYHGSVIEQKFAGIEGNSVFKYAVHDDTIRAVHLGRIVEKHAESTLAEAADLRNAGTVELHSVSGSKLLHLLFPSLQIVGYIDRIHTDIIRQAGIHLDEFGQRAVEYMLHVAIQLLQLLLVHLRLEGIGELLGVHIDKGLMVGIVLHAVGHGGEEETFGRSATNNLATILDNVDVRYLLLVLGHILVAPERTTFEEHVAESALRLIDVGRFANGEMVRIFERNAFSLDMSIVDGDASDEAPPFVDKLLVELQ